MFLSPLGIFTHISSSYNCVSCTHTPKLFLWWEANQEKELLYFFSTNLYHPVSFKLHLLNFKVFFKLTMFSCQLFKLQKWLLNVQWAKEITSYLFSWFQSPFSLTSICSPLSPSLPIPRYGFLELSPLFTNSEKMSFMFVGCIFPVIFLFCHAIPNPHILIIGWKIGREWE